MSSSDLGGCNQGFRQLEQEALNHRKDCLNLGDKDRMMAKYWPQVIFLIFFSWREKESESQDGENETRVESYVCAFISKKPESNMSNLFKNNQKAECAYPNKVDWRGIKKKVREEIKKSQKTW